MICTGCGHIGPKPPPPALSCCPERKPILIAAAPDMFEALEGAAEWLSGWASAEPYLGRIQAARAKARPAVEG